MFQREVWAAYRNGESGLIHAATGTGKTLAAFGGPLLEALADSTDTPLSLRVAWVTPLRALAADTAAALAAPVEALGLPWAVQTRTSDTASSLRNAQRARLPAVLVTTPESLSLLLARDEPAQQFAELRAVVVDEWHELLASKRGVQVELALARLRQWRPGLRVWGLSATLGNLPAARDALCGQQGRLVRGVVPKSVVVDSLLPERVERFPWAGHLGLSMLPQVVAAIDEGRTALVFTNTRAQTEIWYQAILKQRPDWAGVIALHHGSLDQKVRDFVEAGLKSGLLRCVVCTSSLDLGVDFTPVDRVIQVGSPKGVARLLQRAGRSGHRPGVASRVTCVPTNAFELVEVAAARDAAGAGRIEARPPLAKPLDVLAQHLVTVALGGGFRPDELLTEVRSTRAFAELSDAEWNWALDFVRRGGTALRAYPDFRRVEVGDDGVYRVTNVRAARLHRMAIGTIVGDASLEVRWLRGGRLGTVEESFLARLKPGERFTFAGRVLQLVRIRDLTAYVRAAKPGVGTVPRWQGGRMPLSSELAAAVRDKLDEARQGIFTGPELESVRPVLELQAARSKIPSPDELLIERIHTREGHHVFIYPFEGRSVHEGMSALLAYRLSRRVPITFTIAINDYGFELLAADPPPLEEALDDNLLSPDGLADELPASLNAAELAKRAFREVARVAGLVHPGVPGANKSTKQLQASSGLFFDVFTNYDPDNLLLKQARREVLDRQLEGDRLRMALARLSAGRVTITEPRRPTPLAFPLLVERLRETLSSEALADRVKRMQLQYERED